MSASVSSVKAQVNIEPLLYSYGQIDYMSDELLAEYIDNSISATRPGIPTTVNITLIDNTFIYEDNGTGIDRTNLENAISLGSFQTTNPKDGMNEHGLGFKQAMVVMGKFIKLESCTPTKDSYLIEGDKDFVFGLPFLNEVPILDNPEFSTPGIRFELELNENTKAKFQDTSRINETIDRLSAKYQDLLADKQLKIQLNIQGLAKNIQAKKPFLWNFQTNTEGPLLDKIYEASDGSWKAKVVMGYTPDYSKEQKLYTAALKVPIEKGTYSRALNHCGFDFKVGKRVIEHNAKKLSISMGLKETLIKNHSDSNGIHGTIHFIKGFKTQSTKNRMSNNQALSQLQKVIKKDIGDVAVLINNYERKLKRKYTPHTVVSDILKSAKINKKRAHSVVTLNKELHKYTAIKEATLDKTTKTLYLEPEDNVSLDVATLLELNINAAETLIITDPLNLKAQNIRNVIAISKNTQTEHLTRLMAALPALIKTVYQYDKLKEITMMTPVEVKSHMSETMGFK